MQQTKYYALLANGIVFWAGAAESPAEAKMFYADAAFMAKKRAQKKQEQAKPAPVTYEQHIQRLEDRARRFGRESVRDEARSALASMALAREFGESMEDYLKRNPQAEIKHKAYMDWLDGKAKLPEQVPAEASRPADDGAAQWNALTPASRRAAMKAAGVKLPDAVMWEHISDASKQKLRPVVSNMLEHATEPQTATAGAPAEPAQAAQAAVPHFETYDDANDWIERRAKDLGMSRRAFSSNDEYKAIYPQIEALYQDQKAKTSEQRMAALRDAGLAVGDRVQTTVPGMFLDGTDYSGTIVLRGGEPWVKVDGKITVSKNGRLHEASTVRWDSRWKKQTDTDAEHRGAHAA